MLLSIFLNSSFISDTSEVPLYLFPRDCDCCSLTHLCGEICSLIESILWLEGVAQGGTGTTAADRVLQRCTRCRSLLYVRPQEEVRKVKRARRVMPQLYSYTQLRMPQCRVPVLVVVGLLADAIPERMRVSCWARDAGSEGSISRAFHLHSISLSLDIQLWVCSDPLSSRVPMSMHTGLGMLVIS